MGYQLGFPRTTAHCPRPARSERDACSPKPDLRELLRFTIHPGSARESTGRVDSHRGSVYFPCTGATRSGTKDFPCSTSGVQCMWTGGPRKMTLAGAASILAGWGPARRTAGARVANCACACNAFAQVRIPVLGLRLLTWGQAGPQGGISGEHILRPSPSCTRTELLIPLVPDLAGSRKPYGMKGTWESRLPDRPEVP